MAIALAGLSGPAGAQGREVRAGGPAANGSPVAMERSAAGKVTVRAVRLSGPFVFDGALDDAIYHTVPPWTDFVQQEPAEGVPATEKTEAWVFFDDENIYVGARLYESRPDRRVTSDMRRDSFNMYFNDHLAVVFDTFNDRRNGYGFSTNRAGGMFDFFTTNEQPSSNWNGVWEARAGDFDGGWTLEMRIPFRSIRFQAGGDTWGVNLRRMSRWKNETSFLSGVPRSWGRRGLNKLSSEATLVGVATPKPSLNLDVKPYALGSLLTDRVATPSFANRRGGHVGGDVKWGVTPTLVTDFSYNTDFAQVEDDDAQVNLTRFSLIVAEKREFFLEGQDAFAFGGSNSGVFPGSGGGGFSPGSPNTGADLSPVLFYSRRIGLSGSSVVPIVAGARVLGRAAAWQIGALNMRTEPLAAVDAAAATPATSFSVLRVNRDVGRRSRLGLIATSRNPAGGTSGATVGTDAQFNLRDDLALGGYFAKTNKEGKAGDASSYRARLDWTNDRYGVSAEHLFVGDGFSPEVGFLRRSAFRRTFGLARFSPRPAHMPGVRKFTYLASADYITAPSGRLQSEEFRGTFATELSSGDFVTTELTQQFERLDAPFVVARNDTVPTGAYRFTQARASYIFGTQRPVSGTLSVARGGFYDGTLTEETWRGRIEVAPRFVAEPTVSLNQVDGPRGHANTNLVSTRVTYSVTPRMFVGGLLQYQSRTSSFSTNLRLRWEYKPGSELFVVYSDGRSTTAPGYPELENRSVVVKVTRLFRW